MYVWLHGQKIKGKEISSAYTNIQILYSCTRSVTISNRWLSLQSINDSLTLDKAVVSKKKGCQVAPDVFKIARRPKCIHEQLVI